MKIDFPFKPREWQKECFAKQKRFTVLAVHRRAGKTTLALAELILKAVNGKGGLYAYIAPELKQAKLIAWKTLKDMCVPFLNVNNGGKKINLVEFRESELTVRFWTKAEIRLFGADNPDSIRGSKIAGSVIDEVAQMPKELWLEIVYPALMDSKGWALFIGTPKGINLFSDLYDRGNNPLFQKEWAALKFTCYQTGALEKEDIENYKMSVPDETFKREMLCDFSASSADQVISLQEATDAANRSLPLNAANGQSLVMGIDVARFGEDDSVIVFRKGMVMEAPQVFHGLDFVELKEVIVRQARERNPVAIFVDGTGMGSGLVDLLNHSGLFVNDINFGRKSYDPQFTNKRTEMWFKMGSWIKRGGCIPKIDRLISDLAMPTYEVNEKNQKALESKKNIRERCGRSPDYADALALTFAEDIAEPEMEYIGGEKITMPKRETEYNPIKSFEESARHGYSGIMPSYQNIPFGRF